MIIGRIWSAFFSTATILAIFVLVRHIYENNWLALLAAAFFAFSVVSIQVAHFCITEPFITLMAVVIAWLSYEILKTGSWRSYLLSGTAFGIAMAAKTSSLYYILIIIMAHLFFLSSRSAQDWSRADRKNAGNREVLSLLTGLFLAAGFGLFAGVAFKLRGVIQDLFNSDPSRGNLIWVILAVVLVATGSVLSLWGIKEFKTVRGQMNYWIKLSAAGGLAFLMFCLLSPWSLLDFSGFQNSMNYEWHVVSIADACYVLQFKDTLRYWFQLKNLVMVELWWPLGLTVIAGVIWAIARLIGSFFHVSKKSYVLPLPFMTRRGISPSVPDLLLLIWLIPYFGFIGAWNTKFIRYMVPLIPFLCVLGAKFLIVIFDALKSSPRLARGVKALVLAATIGGSLFYSAAYMHVYRFQNPWIDASVWIYKNVPPGSVIFNEAWGDGLPVDVSPSEDSRLDRPMSPSLYRQKDLTPYELYGYPTDDSPVKLNYYANTLQQGDYISISSKKLWYTLTDCSPEFRPHGFNVYPITSRYYRLLWSGLLGYKMVAEFHNFPSLFGWVHPDDMAEESFSVYDHPRVYLFKKMAVVPSAEILKLLSSDDYVRGINRDIMRKITPKNVDAFIAARRDYLKAHGLLDQLNGIPVVPTARPVTAVKVRPKLTVVPKITPVHAKSSALIPTPEPTVLPLVGAPGLPPSATLQVLKQLASDPVVQTSIPKPGVSNQRTESFFYQVRAWGTWVALLLALGILALPFAVKLFEPIPGAAYLLGKILGILLFGWLVWIPVRSKFCVFTIGSCWFWFLVLAALSGILFWFRRKEMGACLKKWSGVWLRQELLFVGLFFLFTLVRIFNPHIHDPVGDGYNGGGEAGMDYGFLASVVRGETFPPENMWMAGQPIGYSFYFGHLLMGVLTKTLGLVPAVTYNLSIISLFALIFMGAFSLAYGLSNRWASGLIAGTLCAVAGNLDGAKQYLRIIRDCVSRHEWSSLWYSTFDFWGPTRVIPHSINEFPYFSVLFADMHAHTLAMPFAMVMIGLIASLYLSRWDIQGGISKTLPALGKKHWPLLASLGFLLGAIAFLNTWEVPTWSALLLLALGLKSLSSTRPKVLAAGLRMAVPVMGTALVALGLYAQIRKYPDPLVLGGVTNALLFFVVLGLAVLTVILFWRKSTRPILVGVSAWVSAFAVVLFFTFIFWFHYFLGFSPQQSEVLWVTPNLRTVSGDYFTLYGFFLSVLLMGFVLVYPNELGRRIVSFKFKWGGNLDRWIQRCADFFSWLAKPQGPVHGALAAGLILWSVIVGASWEHWTNPGPSALEARILGGIILALFIIGAATRQWVWGMVATCFLTLWVLLMTFGVFHLFQDNSPFLNLEFFTLIWFLAFLNLGFAAKTRKNTSLSFTFLLAAMFFLITATLEIFVMKEYLGGDYMRNNSLFKFGINAWTVASVSAGVLLPAIWMRLRDWMKALRIESPMARKVLFGFFFLILSWILHVLLDEIIFSQTLFIASVLNLVFILGILTWAYLEEWFAGWILAVVAVVLAPVMILPLFTINDYTSLVYVIQRLFSGWDSAFLFPSSIVILVMIAVNFLMERRKNRGLRMAGIGWRSLVLLLAAMVMVYPIAGTLRKCHGFLPGTRARAMGYAESPTLNGLAYLSQVNPYDAAAIQFLNARVPGQPCLIEAVGLGYNTWGSRYSIFTGIPALMGWDGHVREWVGDHESPQIDQRYDATEMIYNTHDVQLAKSLLDAYGVRLVVVGPLERGETDPRKHYDPEGLAKFSTFLPLIYKNPEVEIYYNPPVEKS
ncbi:MAG: DUF2298 domain-containing protein [bacterium]